MTTTTKATLRTLIRVELVRRDRTLRELSDALGLSMTGVHRRMSGEVAWNTDELDRVAAFLDIPLADFFTTSP